MKSILKKPTTTLLYAVFLLTDTGMEQLVYAVAEASVLWKQYSDDIGRPNDLPVSNYYR